MQRIFLGPELARFRAMADTADAAGALRAAARATATEQAFDDARDDARKRLIAVALGAGIVIVLLLVTAERRRTHGARGRAPRRARSR